MRLPILLTFAIFVVGVVVVIHVAWCTIGVAICYDIRFPELAQVMAIEKGADMLIYPGGTEPFILIILYLMYLCI